LNAPTHPAASPAVGAPLPDTIFFLSDYGLSDEFVGVVHAVLRRLAPHVTVIDLAHHLRPFDVRSGAFLLARAIQHLGDGVVLGVVDPGVGGARRGVALRAERAASELWLVGPDNGLLIPAAERSGPISMAIELVGPGAEDRWRPVSFDGRDLFAPAAAALCTGTPAERLGTRIDPATLVRLPGPVDERGALTDGRRCVRAEILWVDRFGNVKLSTTLDPELADVLSLEVEIEATVGAGQRESFVLKPVRTFGDLSDDELGVMADADGHLAVVARERSAAMVLDVGVGDLLELVW
jgi:S-adenosyl-L-methionine hydrolase (adenosine-forming)